MFSFIRKKPSAMDAAIHLIYGPNPPRKTADAQQATNMAMSLLRWKIHHTEVKAVAEQLNAGPMPYSTADLAVSVALNIFKRPDLMPSLVEAQITARMEVLEWLKQGFVNTNLAHAFEDDLYARYKRLVTNDTAASLMIFAVQAVELTNEKIRREFIVSSADKGSKMGGGWDDIVSVANDVDRLSDNIKATDQLGRDIVTSFNTEKPLEHCVELLYSCFAANQYTVQTNNVRERNKYVDKLYEPTGEPMIMKKRPPQRKLATIVKVAAEKLANEKK